MKLAILLASKNNYHLVFTENLQSPSKRETPADYRQRMVESATDAFSRHYKDSVVAIAHRRLLDIENLESVALAHCLRSLGVEQKAPESFNSGSSKYLFISHFKRPECLQDLVDREGFDID
jgi:hypothetical protein